MADSRKLVVTPHTGGRSSRVPHFVSWMVTSVLPLAFMASTTAAFALDVYDVVQLAKKGYSDKQIIALIEATDSTFDLRAEDLPRLKRLGVSELVIRKLLERPAAEPPADDAKTTEKASDSPPTHRPEQNEKTTAELPDMRAQPPPEGPPVRDKIPWPMSSYAVAEEGADGHTHIALDLAGAPLLILRDEAGHPSISARAKDLLQRLGEARSLVDGEFRAAHVRGADALIFRGLDVSREVVVMTVTAKDAASCQRRSGRRVTPDLLASYWADLLNDYWAIYFLGRPPTRLVDLHEGEALEVLREAVTRAAESSSQVPDLAAQLPRAVLQHLERLAGAVPMEFRASGHQEKEERQP